MISEEVCDMGSYHTRLTPRAIRAHITHFFTYHTRPSCDIHYYLYSYSTPSITMSLSSHHSYPHLPLHHYQHSPAFSYSLIWGTCRWVMQTSLECPLLLFITSYKTFFMLNISCFLFLILLISISDARC